MLSTSVSPKSDIKHGRLVYTIYGEVSQGGASGSLDFNVTTLEEEENWFEGVFVDGSHI